MLTEADPERYFVPPYVGHRGWLGVRLDRGIAWDELAGIAEDAYAEVAPAKLVEAARVVPEKPIRPGIDPATASLSKTQVGVLTYRTRKRPDQGAAT